MDARNSLHSASLAFPPVTQPRSSTRHLTQTLATHMATPIRAELCPLWPSLPQSIKSPARTPCHATGRAVSLPCHVARAILDGAHREFLELTVDQHRVLKEHCDSIGLGYSCSVWDLTSAREIVSLKPDLIKVGSPSNQHWEMQKVLRDEYAGDVHISTGMTTKVRSRACALPLMRTSSRNLHTLLVSWGLT